MLQLDIRTVTDLREEAGTSALTEHARNAGDCSASTVARLDCNRLAHLNDAGRAALHRYSAAHTPELQEFEEIWAAMDAISPWVMALSLWELGWLRDPTQVLTAEAIASECCSPSRYQPLMSQWLRALAIIGVVHRLPGETLTYAGNLGDDDRIAKRVEQAVAAVDRPTSYPGFIEYFTACVKHQTGLLTGRSNPQKLLFPAGNWRIVDGLYRTNPASAMQNDVAAAIIHGACKELSHRRPIRILEVGAGTGATTAAILETTRGMPVQYHFTDVSRFFTRRAVRQFAQYPCVTYDTLDIDLPPAEQGFGDVSFDLIVAANVLHTSRHIEQMLGHLRGLLSADGVMVAIETTANTTLQMITFGHFEGVCHFQDQRRHTNLPFLSCSQWQCAFQDAGFGQFTAISSSQQLTGWTQHVLLASQSHVQQ